MLKKNFGLGETTLRSFGCVLRIFILSCVSAVQTAFAGAEAYQCEILNAIGMDEEGRFKHDNGYWVGQKFVVDMDTGRTNGALRNYSDNQEPLIIRQGSATDAMKVITVFGGGNIVDYLYISVYSSTAYKPFFFVSGADLFSGSCYRP